MDWKNFIAGIGYSLLPKRWWGDWKYSSTTDFARSALASGLLELIVFGRLTLIWFARFMIGRSKLVADVGMNEGTQLWVLGIFLVDFIVQPSSIVLVYFTLEGFVRAYTAWLHGTVLPTLPCYLAAQWQGRHARHLQNQAPEPALADIVEQISSDEVRITSSRSKDWTASTTICYRDRMWEVADSEQMPGDRKFVYRLKVRTSNVAIRALRTYESESEESPKK